MQANKATPVLAGRSAQDRGTLAMLTVLTLAFQALFVSLWFTEAIGEPGVVWMALLWAALLADAWASATALREAARGVARPLNRWDLAAVLLAGASIAAVPILLGARTPASALPIPRATAGACLSALVLVWFVLRARFRARLPVELRGWPQNDRGRPRIPKQVSDGIGAKVALGVCSLAVVVGTDFLRSSVPFVAVLFVCIAAEGVSATRRATDTLWERPTAGFGNDDLRAIVFACLAFPIGVAGLALNLPDTTERRWDVLLYAGAVTLYSVIAIGRGRRRWKQRHDPQDLLSIWD